MTLHQGIAGTPERVAEVVLVAGKISKRLGYGAECHRKVDICSSEGGVVVVFDLRDLLYCLHW